MTPDSDDRIQRIEQQLRRYHRLTIVLLSVVVLMVAGAAFVIWRSIPKSVEDIVGGDVVGRSLHLWDELPRAKITSHKSGWSIQMMMTEEGWTPSGAAALTYTLSDGKPRLTMTDARGHEVWQAP
jgi:hypothetical protein